MPLIQVWVKLSRRPGESEASCS